MSIFSFCFYWNTHRHWTKALWQCNAFIGGISFSKNTNTGQYDVPPGINFRSCWTFSSLSIYKMLKSFMRYTSLWRSWKMGNKLPAAFKSVHALNSELIRPLIRPIGWATRPLAWALMYSNSGAHLLTIHDAAKLCRSSDWCIINTNLSEGQEASSCTCAHTRAHTHTSGSCSGPWRYPLSLPDSKGLSTPKNKQWSKNDLSF